MTNQQLKQAITKVSEATNQTEQQIEDKLFAKDSWIHFLIREASKG